MAPSRLSDPGALAELADERAPRVPWAAFLTLFAHGRDGFRQGDHVSIIAPNGGGKTTLALEVVELRDYVLGLFTKPRDPVIETLPGRGWRVTRRLDVRIADGRVLDRWVAYHPVFRVGTVKSRMERQAAAIRSALVYAFDAGGWCVLADELIWLTQMLGLTDELNTFWYQARALDGSLVALAQRPFHVPRAALDQAEHVFLGHFSDRDDVRRLAELGGSVDLGLLRHVVSRLDRYEYLYVQPHSGVMLRVRVDLSGRPQVGAGPKPIRLDDQAVAHRGGDARGD